LVSVDDPVLDRLIGAAVADADPDDVTPPLGTGWTAARTAWLESFHRSRRDRIDGLGFEATWAVVVGGEVVGSVRLEQMETPETLEMGIWLTRRARRRGIGLASMTELLRVAGQNGARVVRAETTINNTPALALLRRLGFDLAPATEERVEAELVLDAARG
jgi:RimJ/RimL family protein N-acetyltransferase